MPLGSGSVREGPGAPKPGRERCRAFCPRRRHLKIYVSKGSAEVAGGLSVLREYLSAGLAEAQQLAKT
eukprot:1672179-Pyramimonas_sp.AAC.1